MSTTTRFTPSEMSLGWGYPAPQPVATDVSTTQSAPQGPAAESRETTTYSRNPLKRHFQKKEDTIRDQDRRINAAISGLSTNLSEVAEGSAPSVDYRQTRSRQEPVMYQAADSLINYHKATYDHQHRPHIPGRLQDTKAARSDQFYSSLVNCQSTKSWAQKKVGAMRAELGTTGDASFLDGFYLKSEGGQEATSSSGEKNDAASKEIRAEVITTLGDLGFKDFGQAAWGNTLQYEYCRQHE